ncbi:hypothetical protein PRIPAC_76888 [Pristionchus pacificus]|uniref:Nuclear receptor n=1 Tax=Pristionchus pacificus TaxID=54126 RepID=A0A8R1U8Y4_PRIPA|nr:hypothetical protein PRIPAC_76888 [Pristionchus pacificus]
MPRSKSLKKTVKCLVCSLTTDCANLGLDVCRACTVFYRRSRNRKYVCRSGTEKCPIGEGINCRRCRLKELERKLEGKPLDELLRASLSEKGESAPTEDSYSESAPSTSTASEASCMTNKTAAKRSILERLEQGYRAMCDTRLTGELNNRTTPTHPLDVIEGKYEIIPGTFRAIDAANRIFLTALLQFGSCTFPGFSELPRDDKWTIVTNFFGRFRAFDAGYRAERAFGHLSEKTFAGYTLSFDGSMSPNFFEGVPVSDEKEARRIMEDKFNGDFRTGRKHLNDAKLRHEEFLAVLALMFWTTDGLPVSEIASKHSKTSRAAVLRELHSYFRDDLGLDDYAPRLGKLLMLLQIFEQRSSCTLEHFEVLRLLNVFTDDSISYRTIKDTD